MSVAGPDQERKDRNETERWLLADLGCLGQRLHSRICQSSALYFLNGRLRNDYGRTQARQQVKLPYRDQQDHWRRIDDPECNHAGSPP